MTIGDKADAVAHRSGDEFLLIEVRMMFALEGADRVARALPA
jgi:hypothetical protein